MVPASRREHSDLSSVNPPGRRLPPWLTMQQKRNRSKQQGTVFCGLFSTWTPHGDAASKSKLCTNWFQDGVALYFSLIYAVGVSSLLPNNDTTLCVGRL